MRNTMRVSEKSLIKNPLGGLLSEKSLTQNPLAFQTLRIRKKPALTNRNSPRSPKDSPKISKIDINSHLLKLGGESTKATTQRGMTAQVGYRSRRKFE